MISLCVVWSVSLCIAARDGELRSEFMAKFKERRTKRRGFSQQFPLMCSMNKESSQKWLQRRINIDKVLKDDIFPSNFLVLSLLSPDTHHE